MSRLALALPPTDHPLLSTLSAHCDIAALLWPSVQPVDQISIPAFTKTSALLEAAAPEACVFIQPYPDAKLDALALLAAQIPVYSVGPLDFSPNDTATLTRSQSPSRYICGGLFKHDPKHTELMRQCNNVDFGRGVFLRATTGGGTSLLRAWWQLDALLNQSMDLFGSNKGSLYLSAQQSDSNFHLNLQINFSNGAHAQLTVAPTQLGPAPDLLLLGSGGLLSLPLTGNDPVLLGPNGYAPLHLGPSPLVPWLHHVQSAPIPPVPTFSYHLLQTIKQVLEQGRPQKFALNL
jgi:hypothetical protein